MRTQLGIVVAGSEGSRSLHCCIRRVSIRSSSSGTQQQRAYPKINRGLASISLRRIRDSERATHPRNNLHGRRRDVQGGLSGG